VSVHPHVSAPKLVDGFRLNLVFETALKIVYFVIDSVRKRLDIPSYTEQ